MSGEREERRVRRDSLTPALTLNGGPTFRNGTQATVQGLQGSRTLTASILVQDD